MTRRVPALLMLPGIARSRKGRLAIARPSRGNSVPIPGTTAGNPDPRQQCGPRVFLLGARLLLARLLDHWLIGLGRGGLAADYCLAGTGALVADHRSGHHARLGI
jgi:hypothetical protein